MVKNFQGQAKIKITDRDLSSLIKMGKTMESGGPIGRGCRNKEMDHSGREDDEIASRTDFVIEDSDGNKWIRCNT